MQEWNREEVEKEYRIKDWGQGYFDVNELGHLSVCPTANCPTGNIDISEIVKEMTSQGIQLPAVIRFHDILRSRVKEINKTFMSMIDESHYEGRYMGVYPIKVNQMREVVEEILDAGAPFDFGLEAGSKAELLAVLALNVNSKSLTILNGYKDEDYLKLALLGQKLGRKMVVVIEKFTELEKLIALSKKEDGLMPMIGLRSKMHIKGRGKWADSSGERAKFGLSASELINAVELMKKEGHLEKIKLFHFHIGSQITDIRSIKDAINEGARVYAKLSLMGAPIEYFDVGGGLGVDYDGSHSANDSSINYSMKEYARDIVYGLKQICDLEEVHHPNIVTESGRAITAHHSCVITNVIGSVESIGMEVNTKKVTGEHHLVTNIRELFQELTQENQLEIYNELMAIKSDAYNAFKLGILSLEERAKIETMYWKLCAEIYTAIEDKETEEVPEELWHLEEELAPQYLCNFSVFQSTADVWAIEQLLPILPITRLNEKPTRKCTLADITCDSDGKINRFLDREAGQSKNLSLHKLKPNEPYYLGIFMTGAYQDVMGDMHNLFGRLNEVHVFSDSEDSNNFYIEEVIKGNMSKDVLVTMQYNPEYMAMSIKKIVDRRVAKSKIKAREGVRLVDFYEKCLESYTYLS